MSTPKERPILFKGEMVRAVLDGRKTQTRRIVKPMRHPFGDVYTPNHVADEFMSKTGAFACPYGRPGDRLWVRETWIDLSPYEETDVKRAAYKASFGNVPSDARWKPSIHMPRWASRITLEITEVRVQRLREISEEDAIAEGISTLNVPPGILKGQNKFAVSMGGFLLNAPTARECFLMLFASINGQEVVDANPYVWAISFKIVAPTPSAKGGE